MVIMLPKPLSLSGVGWDSLHFLHLKGVMLGNCYKIQYCDYALVNVSFSNQRDFSFSSLHFWSCRGKWKCMALQDWVWQKSAMSLLIPGPCMVSYADQWIWVLLYRVLKCTGKTLLLAVKKLVSNLQKFKKKSLCQLLITFIGMKATEGNSAFRKEPFWDAVYSHPGCFRSHHS